jgi:hypothetical protein
MTVTPQEVLVGDTATITATVSNAGNAAGVYSTELMVNEIVVKTYQLTLAPGQSQRRLASGSFFFSRHHHRVGTIGLSWQAATIGQQGLSRCQDSRLWHQLAILIGSDQEVLALMPFYRRLAGETAERLNYAYPYEMDKAISEFILGNPPV